jgi:hypothetical protein
MTAFKLVGLPAELFSPLFALSDAQLLEHNARRVIAAAKPGYPCRVSLADAEIGDELLLLPFEHQPATDAGVCQGNYAAAAIQKMLADDAVAYIHLHNANRGCFSCTAVRG